MKNAIIGCMMAVILGVGYGCQDETIGYLWTENASYDPDTLIVKKNLNVTPPSWGIWPNPEWNELLEEGYTEQDLIEWGLSPTYEGMGGEGEDYYRKKWGQPWISIPIEGIQGTHQIYVTVKEIKTVTGNADKLREYLTVRGNGVFEVPPMHDIPAGRYVISLTFTNEGYTKDIDNCFTIIVK